jgi:replicative DNA helicase
MGLHPGNIIILAARPSMGKTSLAMNIAEHVALGDKHPDKKPCAVGVFSLEMASSELAMRMICSHARVSAFKITSGYISQSKDHSSLVMAADKLMKAPMFIDDTAGLDIQELRARARRMKKLHDIQFVVVDYLQLLRSDKHAHMGREREIADVSGQLKAMAKELSVPVMVLSQLSRAPEIRDKTGRPKLSDLRDSGSIEQDADVVMLLRRPCKYPDDDESIDQSLAIVDIAKHRNGPVNDNLRLNFFEDIMRFEDRRDQGLDHEEAPAFGDDEAAMG